MRLLLLFFLSKSKICRWQVPLAVYVVLISQSVYANKIYLEIVINFYPTKRRMKMAIFNRNSFVQKTRITIQYCGANLLWNTRLVFSLNIWPIKDIKTRIKRQEWKKEQTKLTFINVKLLNETCHPIEKWFRAICVWQLIHVRACRTVVKINDTWNIILASLYHVNANMLLCSIKDSFSFPKRNYSAKKRTKKIVWFCYLSRCT